MTVLAIPEGVSISGVVRIDMILISPYLGKSGAVHGAVHDATPFKFGEEKGHDVDAIDFFARQLETAGYNYYGTETMYSGTDGVPMKASARRDFLFEVIPLDRPKNMREMSL